MLQIQRSGTEQPYSRTWAPIANLNRILTSQSTYNTLYPVHGAVIVNGRGSISKHRLQVEKEAQIVEVRQAIPGEENIPT